MVVFSGLILEGECPLFETFDKSRDHFSLNSTSTPQAPRTDPPICLFSAQIKRISEILKNAIASCPFCQTKYPFLMSGAPFFVSPVTRDAVAKRRDVGGGADDERRTSWRIPDAGRWDKFRSGNRPILEERGERG